MEPSTKKYNKTLIACYMGFITQAITANFAPLLFLMFNKNYGVSLGKIALIVGSSNSILESCIKG